MDTQRVVNAHLQVSGITGMGKTFMLQELVSTLVESAAELGRPVRVHVFDAHGDIELPFSSTVKFTEATRYGYNPLDLNPNPDFGGVRRAIEKFIVAIKKLYTFGARQEAVMRYLLEDLFASRGFRADDPATWMPDDPRLVREVMRNRHGRIYLNVSREQQARFRELITDPVTGLVCGGYDDFADHPSLRLSASWWVQEASYDGDLLLWEPCHPFKVPPTIDDAVRFVESKLKAQFCGTNVAAISLLNEVNRASRLYHRKVDAKRAQETTASEQELAKLHDDLVKAREKAGRAYAGYLESIETGRELDEVLRYNSTEVLTAVYERWQNLRAKGIYCTDPPPFEPHQPVWRYSIHTLEVPTQRLLVDLVSARVFERSLQRGLQDEVVEILVVDEAKRFVDERGDDILCACVNEGRKFGLGVWLFSQSPAHFPDDLIKGTGTIIVLGLASADRKLSARKLGLEERQFDTVVPQESALVQIRNKKVLTSSFELVKLS